MAKPALTLPPGELIYIKIRSLLMDLKYSSCVIFKVLLLSVIIIMTSYTNVNCENIHFRKFYQLVLINDLTSPKMLAHLLKYDSSQGRYEKADTVVAGENFGLLYMHEL